jgi:hypothetical protein
MIFMGNSMVVVMDKFIVFVGNSIVSWEILWFLWGNYENCMFFKRNPNSMERLWE